MKEELAQLRASVEERVKSVESKIPVPQGALPERFVKLYGDNPEAYRLYKEEQEELLSQAEARWEARQEAARQEEATQVERGREYVDEAMGILHEEGKDFNDNELMKFMLDFKAKYGVMPKDENDNIDFHRGYDLFLEFNKDKVDSEKQKSASRKKIAGFTTSQKKSTEAGEKDYVTNLDLKDFDPRNI
jgi:hypothetical protein